jgi:hypothetical protein
MSDPGNDATHTIALAAGKRLKQDSGNFDLVDTEAELNSSRWPRLQPHLRDCLTPIYAQDNADAGWADSEPGTSELSLTEYYCGVNDAAIRSQGVHRRLVKTAAIFGAAAVFVAILQLPDFSLLSPFAMTIVEAVFTVTALVAVGIGLWAAHAHRWRMRRFKAEACRFLKFNYLLNDGAVCIVRRVVERGDDGESVRHIRERSTLDAVVGQVDLLHEGETPRKWVRRELRAMQIDRDKSHTPDAEYVEQLAGYYAEKRIAYQRAYFESQEGSREKSEKQTVHWPTRLFFLSVCSALVHFGVELVHKGVEAYSADAHVAATTGADKPQAEQQIVGPALNTAPSEELAECRKLLAENSRKKSYWHLASVLLLIVAASAPILGASVRTIRSALEYGRNANRYHALVERLGDLQEQLAYKDAATADKLDLMWEVERALENEHRSWMRLMVEAEWFG